MVKKAVVLKELRGKTDQELQALVKEAREALRAERFKDKFSRNGNFIKSEKQKIAQVLTELTARRRNVEQS